MIDNWYGFRSVVLMGTENKFQVRSSEGKDNINRFRACSSCGGRTISSRSGVHIGDS